jgi:hypothetical protein
VLDRLIPLPRLLETDTVDLAAPPPEVWRLLRHGNLARSPFVKALFELRTLPGRFSNDGGHDGRLQLDDLTSTKDRPGFQILGENPEHEIAVGAIGKVWHLNIPFVHVADAEAFHAFEAPDYVKVAWSIRVTPRGERDTHVEFELRVDATDDEAWRKFRRYFALIGPFSRFIRRSLLRSFERELGIPDELESERPLVGDERLPDATAQFTHGITIAAPPERIWPWLVQLGCRRAGFYAVDVLDNAGVPSAREIHPELQQLEVGRVLPATPGGNEGFEVLAIDAPNVLVLGALYDGPTRLQLPFAAPRPSEFWQMTWSFVLEPIDPERTRLHVRVRAAFSSAGNRRALLLTPVHHFMQTAMLEHLAARVEDRLPRDDLSDVLEGMKGIGAISFALLTPLGRPGRRHFGVDAETAARTYPGDELVPEPVWDWTHGIEIDAPASAVWPWIAQIGADRAGFYSYQWLENLAGCNVRNAEVVHPEWAARVGDELLLHPDPKAPRLRIVAAEPDRYLLAQDAPDETRRKQGAPWSHASWLFFIEPLGARRCRLISRYRLACSSDLATRLAFGPGLLEPVGFAMDRRMLLGIKERTERVEGQRSERP